MKFRFNFQISEKTVLKPNAVIQNIELELDNKEYDIKSVTNDMVRFSTSPWQLRWNFEPTQLDGGTFTVNSSDEGATINLHYYFNFLPNILLMTIMTITLATRGAYDGIWFFLAFFLITGVIHIFTIKNKAKQLLQAVSGSEDPE